MRAIIFFLKNHWSSSIIGLVRSSGPNFYISKSIFKGGIFPFERSALFFSTLCFLLEFFDFSVFVLYLFDKFPPLVVIVFMVTSCLLEWSDLISLLLDKISKTLQFRDLVALIRIADVHEILQLPTQLFQLLSQLVVFFKEKGFISGLVRSRWSWWVCLLSPDTWCPNGLASGRMSVVLVIWRCWWLPSAYHLVVLIIKF